MCAAVETAHAQGPLTAGGRLFRTQRAFLARKGTVSFSLSGSYFSKGNDYLDPVSGTVTALNQNNIDIALEYVATKNFSTTIATNIFQDRHPIADTRQQYFGNANLAFKLGSIPMAGDYLYFGSVLNIVAPFARQINIPFVPYGYQSGSFEIGGLLLLSYYLDNIFPDRSLGFHLNFGVQNYFNTDTDISRNQSINSGIVRNTVGVRTAFGAEYPTTYIDIMAEISGEFYVGTRPPLIAYGREDYLYAGLGLRGRPLQWLNVELLGEFLVLGGTNTTRYDIGAPFGVTQVSQSDLNYVPFRISGGLRFDLTRRFNLFTADDGYFESNDPQRQFSDDEQRRNKLILDIIDERSEDLTAIYKDARRLDNSLEGRVYFEIQVVKDGSVKNVRMLVSSFNETPIALQTERFMTEKVKTWRFPPGGQDLILEILRLDFSPRGTTRLTQ